MPKLTPRERSNKIFPAGSNGEFNLPETMTIVISRGEGCRLWDTDGHEYLDFSMGWGSALVGHARPEIVEAVTRQAARGANFAYVTEPSLELAEELARLSPACASLRYCASGTEATMICLRIARAVKGRAKILKFEGAYHGANSEGITSLFPSEFIDFPTPQPSSAGIDPHVRDHLLIAPYNDLMTTTDIIRRHADQLAAVIVEPLQRCVPPVEGFLKGLRQLTRANDILLIFDEVVTGFRLAYGGAQEYYGVVPDMIAYGKALGGGYPIGVYGGARPLIDCVREDRLGSDRYVWTASTLGGNPVSCSAALATLQILREPEVYPRLHRLGEYLRRQMRNVLHERRIEGQVIGDGPLAQVVFTSEPVVDYRSTHRSDRAFGRAVMLDLFQQRVFLNPMGTKLYLSLAHDEQICNQFLDRFDRALLRCRDER